MDRQGVSIQAGWTAGDSASLTVTRGPTTFIIFVRFADIEQTAWGQRYLQQIGWLPSTENEDSRPRADGYDMVMTLAMPLILEQAPRATIQGLRLESLCRSVTLRLAIRGPSPGKVGDARVVNVALAKPEPSHNLWPFPVEELPASCASIPRVKASRVKLATAEGNPDPRSAEVPQGKVYLSRGRVAWLKPCFGHTQFKREVAILGRVMELRSEGGSGLTHCRIPRLLGIVVTGEHGELAVGMLIEMITPSPGGIDLLSDALRARSDMHAKWKEQVVATVKALHAHDLIWGDVNAGNVVVDDQWNAWVIDFGGLNNPQFVDDELAETKEGDWQGVGRLFGRWLDTREGDSEGVRTATR